MTEDARTNGWSPYAHGYRYCSLCQDWYAAKPTQTLDAWMENSQGTPICPECSKPLRGRPRKHTRRWREQYLQEVTQ